MVAPSFVEAPLKQLKTYSMVLKQIESTHGHWDTGTPPERGCITGAQMPLHTSIVSNFMIYQDQFETNLLQLFAPTQNSGWFSIISVSSFEVNIVAKNVNA